MSQTVLDSADTVVDLVGSHRVTDRWDAESACAGMTTGGLAQHLAAQVTSLVRVLSAGPHSEAPIALVEHYRRAAWVHSGLDEEANVSIRAQADEAATAGPGALLSLLGADRAALPAALAAVDDDVPVLIPWQGWALSAHDFVVTRLMEMLVHSDDLAASVDLPTPEFPPEAVRLVVGLLSEVAVMRHGQVAVVRALSRPQRAPASVSAF